MTMIRIALNMALITTIAITMMMITFHCNNNDDDKNRNGMALVTTMAITMTMITFHCYSDHVAIRMTKIRTAMQWHLSARHTHIARAMARVFMARVIRSLLKLIRSLLTLEECQSNGTCMRGTHISHTYHIIHIGRARALVCVKGTRMRHSYAALVCGTRTRHS
jgi:hypothetical protein